jgi:phenylalanyl-tRNA synthetase beta chain
MRRTLMTSALETVRDNLRFVDRVAIFEIGRVYWPQEGELLPQEPRHLSIALTGSRAARSWLDSEPQPFEFYDLKGIVDVLLARLGLADAVFAQLTHPTFHPGRAASLSIGGAQVGVLGEVHPDVCEAYDLGTDRVCLAEINLELLLATAGRPVLMRPVSTYPAVYEDLAIVVEEGVPAAHVRELIVEAGGSMLRKVELFDVYRGQQMGEGRKSLAYALTYQADDRTLDAKAAARIRNKIVRRLEHELGATLRA